MRKRASTDGFVLIELLIDTLSVGALVALPAMFAVQSTTVALEASASRTQAVYRAMQVDLENLHAHQAIHYADESVFATSEAELSYTTAEGVEISIVASSVGWSGTATHAALGDGEGCAIYVGAVFAPAVPVTPSRPGEVVCTE